MGTMTLYPGRLLNLGCIVLTKTQSRARCRTWKRAFPRRAPASARIMSQWSQEPDQRVLPQTSESTPLIAPLDFPPEILPKGAIAISEFVFVIAMILSGVIEFGFKNLYRIPTRNFWLLKKQQQKRVSMFKKHCQGMKNAQLCQNSKLQ